MKNTRGYPKLEPIVRRRMFIRNRVMPPPEIVGPSLRMFWTEKYRFCIRSLRLSKDRAQEWATRSVRVKVQLAESERSENGKWHANRP